MKPPDRITYIASTDGRGKVVPFGIKEGDRAKHVYIIGKTGMGKSTLLENMAVQDIQSGQGMAFIDPHGATAEKLLDYIPEERLGDVLYLAPFDIENPVSFNVMEDIGLDKRHLVVSGLMATFKKIWVDAWSGRMEYILTNTILALLEFPGSTLLGVNRMLSDSDYRDLVVSNVKDAAVRAFWVDEFAQYNEKYMQEAGDAIKNKVGQFTSNPLIRNIIGQPKSSFDLRDMMDKKKIIIVNLSKGRVGETNMALLGSMLTTRIYIAAMSRADDPNFSALPNFFLYVDEFQNFANDTFSDILSEARKYKLNLTIAHQYIEQMEEEVRDAVFGNVGTTIAFRVGPFDAETLEKVFMPKFTPEDLVSLGFTQIYLTLMIDGVGSPPFSAKTLGPIPMPRISQKERVILHSQERFARPRSVVDQDIVNWYKPVSAPEGFTLVKGGGGKRKPSSFSASGKLMTKEPERKGASAPSRAHESVAGQPAPRFEKNDRPADVAMASAVKAPESHQEQRFDKKHDQKREHHVVGHKAPFNPRPLPAASSHPQSVERPHHQTHSEQPPRISPSPSLHDLRATLKSISEKQQTQKHQPPHPGAGLKDALQKVTPPPEKVTAVRQDQHLGAVVNDGPKPVPTQDPSEEVLRRLLSDI